MYLWPGFDSCNSQLSDYNFISVAWEKRALSFFTDQTAQVFSSNLFSTLVALFKEESSIYKGLSDMHVMVIPKFTMISYHWTTWYIAFCDWFSQHGIDLPEMREERYWQLYPPNTEPRNNNFNRYVLLYIRRFHWALSCSRWWSTGSFQC
jgi:hypothetical protein